MAANGKEALQEIPIVKPDLVTLDINMPIMDGHETLRLLHEIYPQARVIMISTHTSEGAHATLKALENGALDFITKPDTDDELLNGKLLRDQFVDLFTQFIDSDVNRDISSRAASVRKTSISEGNAFCTPQVSCPVKPEVVAIGISTGGPAALKELLPLLPAHFPLPVLIVQHMPRLFTKTFAESLEKNSKLKIGEARDGEEVKPGAVYIAPGGAQMKVKRGERGEVLVQITDDPAENFCKPSADYLFRSVAQVYGSKALGVIMTGMGSDGTLGLKLMKQQGAQIIAQDRETCVVWGMPRMAFESGVVDIELPLHEIAPELIRISGK